MRRVTTCLMLLALLCSTRAASRRLGLFTPPQAPVLDSTACSGSSVANCPYLRQPGTTTVVSPAVTTGQAVELIVVLVATKNPTGTTTLTTSGGSFSSAMTLVASNSASALKTEVWSGVTSAALSGVTFTNTITTSWDESSIMVLPFSTSTLTVGANASNAGTGVATGNVSVTTSGNGVGSSMVYIAGGDFNNTTQTPAANTTMVHDQSTYFLSSTVPTGTGTTSYGVTTGELTFWDYTAVEVKGK